MGNIFTLSIIASSLLFTSLLADDTNSSVKTKQFMDKYIKQDSQSYQAGKQVVSEDQRKKISSNTNMYDMVKANRDLNNTDYSIGLTKSKELKAHGESIASEVNKVSRQRWATERKDYEEYILNDKDLDFKNKMGIYGQNAQLESQAQQQAQMYKNNFLADDERLIIAISSSVPDTTIQNMMRSLTKVNTDVMFVMNGLVGNNPKFFQPTMDYVNKLLQKDGGSTVSSERFEFRVDINPKIFTKYAIEFAPAVIFVKNYNFYSEIQGNAQSQELNGIDKEDVYIAYGDQEVIQTLQKINKKAKSSGLSKLIKTTEQGFFK